jgi:cystathionine beta-lyase/cystathionine gamma-synthase
MKNRDDLELRFGTRAVHAGQHPDPSTGSIMTPVHLTSTYVQKSPGEHFGYEYARVSNPTRDALEGNLAALEGARHGICFASGVAAIDALIKCLRPGDHIISCDDLYGGTYRLFRQTFEPFGYSFSFIDMSDPQNVRDAVTDQTRMIWVETPTNPLLRIIDIAEVSKIARQAGAFVAVDNTFASPYLQQPLELGADLVMHSTTKYLGGHSDVIGGAICTSDDNLAEKLRFQIKSSGAVPGPMDCYLVLRGTKTLHLRMDRHCENASKVAEYLVAHPKVDTVFYPGFSDHPGYEIAARQMSNFGGMVSLILKDDRVEAAFRVMSATKIFQLAESLGGVESLVGHPATMTHASIPADVRRAAGLSDSLIRLSVGVEDADDLIEDLSQALASASTG